VRALVRNPSKPAARALGDAGAELHHGDVLDDDSLAGAGADVDLAYYLVHSMGSGAGDGDFSRRDARAAESFARACARDGVGRIVYLGGLGDTPGSKHLRSRHETAEILEEHGPPLTYLRAGMVVGSESASYQTLRHLVARLPIMLAPSWLRNATQPIDVDDVLAYLEAAPAVAASAGREVQIGGPDVLSYGAMLDRMADALDVRRRPKLPVPLLTPYLSSLWLGLVTPVDTSIARPLVEGLTTPTIVTDDSGMELFDVAPIGFDASLRKAVAEEHAAASTT